MNVKNAIKGDQVGAAHYAIREASIGENRQEATPHCAAENDFNGGTMEMEFFWIT